MKKIIILDFSTANVLVYTYDPNIWDDAEDFLSSEEIGLREQDCQWMIVDELIIKINN